MEQIKYSKMVRNRVVGYFQYQLNRHEGFNKQRPAASQTKEITNLEKSSCCIYIIINIADSRSSTRF